MKPVKNILLFNAAADRQVTVHFDQGTFWLTQKAMALLFGVDRTVITKHIKHIFESGELDEPSVCAIFAHTADDGKNYQTQFYRLEAILAVGYRVNSVQATDFRKWATQTLNEFIIKGFVLDNFLELSNYPILQDKGKVTMLEAKLKAEGEFEKYRVVQDRDYESDFDKLVQGMKQ